MPRFRSSSRAGLLLLGLSGRDRDKEFADGTDYSHGHISHDGEPSHAERGQQHGSPMGSKRSYHAAEISSSSSSSVGSTASSPVNSEPVSPLHASAPPQMSYFPYVNTPTSAPSANSGWTAAASAIGGDRTSKRLPTLDDVLSDDAMCPFSLTEFIAYLAQNHCLETLEFTMDVKRYGEIYEAALANVATPTVRITPEHRSYDHLMLLWHRITDSYIRPDSPRELNLPANVRDDLLLLARVNLPPSPDKFTQAVSAVKDLMNESVFIRFLNDAQAVVVPEEPELEEVTLSASHPWRIQSLQHHHSSRRQHRPSSRSISAGIPPDQSRPEYFRATGSGSSEEDSGYTYSGSVSPMTPPESPEVVFDEEFPESTPAAFGVRHGIMSNNAGASGLKQLQGWRRMSKRFKWRSGSSTGER
ncbi:RGS domain-containing protein [Lipomyces tetrasporus]|uniref:RGS domain-containing protein n=1 Tax=Lipomyces tetrasporus TaxID=54092 RepID=A0AAD7VNY0_9ASCO|nr:RGS domain-containing protein [Lipomyces tetrasporus]KAJ8096997.1 RGS domain-containing protein [Lipomyces tetrasporus]